jgi:hypothetical protein
VFFDSLGLQWEYEPEGYELDGFVRYLPDFLVKYPGEPDVWFEVKASLSSISEDEFRKIKKFAEAVTDKVILLDGTPDMKMYHQIYSELSYPIKPLSPTEMGCALWSGKGRIWVDGAEYFDPKWAWDSRALPVLQKAVNAARSARFEYGQNGTT